MRHVLGWLRENRPLVVTVILLTLVMTFPTILYVFRTDIIWLPDGDFDVFIEFWDIWYGRKFLTGQADRFYTNLIFYPEGVSLTYHSFVIPNIIVVNALSLVMPVSNAYNLAFLLIIVASAISAYVYLLWLFKDKWIALFGAVVFGFSPHVVAHPNHPALAFMALAPLIVYGFHRGVRQNRPLLLILAGLLTGLTTLIVMYMYICVLITLGFFICAFAVSRWRDRRFWQCVLLLVLAIAASSIWQIYPLMASSASIEEAAQWHGEREIKNDALSFFINYQNPVIGRLAESIVHIRGGGHISTTSYLGYLPLLLICLGLFSRVTRRRMLPWALLCAVFLVLRLGSHLNVNGAMYLDILLPKYYLDQILPIVFESFREVDHFMIGALLPFSVLTCYGLVAIRKRFAIAAKPAYVLALVAVVAVEYWIPLQWRVIPDEQIAFLDWITQEGEDDDIRLINLPMGRSNSKWYDLYQSFSGYPQVEGAISRTPEGAFDYFRANALLNAWFDRRSIHCDTPDRDTYLAGLAQLEQDGFSHVVYHRTRYNWAEVRESFEGIQPSYRDDFVSIYRMEDLRNSCPRQLDTVQRFAFAHAEALKKPSILDERPGTVVIFPPSAQANDYFMRYLRVFSEIETPVVTVTGAARDGVKAESSTALDSDSNVDLTMYNAVWLINDLAEFNAKQTEAYRDWFIERFKFCARFQEDDRRSYDLYLRSELPCAAVDARSAFEVRYDNGLRLLNASFDVLADKIRFYLAWAKTTNDSIGYSIQILGEDGNKALQYDNVIYGQPLAMPELETTALPEGVYNVQLIVYDFETRVSKGGRISETAQRFERELQLGKLELPG